MTSASTFELLAEPTRRRLLDEVRDQERSVSDLVERLQMSQPGISRHLRILREGGLVDVRHEAQRRLYRVRAAPLIEIDAWLGPYRRFWTPRLDALGRHLDATAESGATDTSNKDDNP
jgi:DNA-binding transcriptional ArsR family regulator